MTEPSFNFEYNHSLRVGGLVGNREFFEEMLATIRLAQFLDRLRTTNAAVLASRLDEALNSPPPREPAPEGEKSNRIKRKEHLGRLLLEYDDVPPEKEK